MPQIAIDMHLNFDSGGGRGPVRRVEISVELPGAGQQAPSGNASSGVGSLHTASDALCAQLQFDAASSESDGVQSPHDSDATSPCASPAGSGELAERLTWPFRLRRRVNPIFLNTAGPGSGGDAQKSGAHAAPSWRQSKRTGAAATPPSPVAEPDIATRTKRHSFPERRTPLWKAIFRAIFGRRARGSRRRHDDAAAPAAVRQQAAPQQRSSVTVERVKSMLGRADISLGEFIMSHHEFNQRMLGQCKAEHCEENWLCYNDLFSALKLIVSGGASPASAHTLVDAISAIHDKYIAPCANLTVNISSDQLQMFTAMRSMVKIYSASVPMPERRPSTAAGAPHAHAHGSGGSSGDGNLVLQGPESGTPSSPLHVPSALDPLDFFIGRPSVSDGSDGEPGGSPSDSGMAAQWAFVCRESKRTLNTFRIQMLSNMHQQMEKFVSDHLDEIADAIPEFINRHSRVVPR